MITVSIMKNIIILLTVILFMGVCQAQTLRVDKLSVGTSTISSERFNVSTAGQISGPIRSIPGSMVDTTGWAFGSGQSLRFPTWTAISSSNLDGYLASPFVDGSTLFVVSGSANSTTMVHWSSDLITWSKRTMAIIGHDYAEKALSLGGYHFVIGTDGLYRSSDLRTSDGTKILNMPLTSMFVDGGSLWVLSNYTAYKSIDYGTSFSPQFPIVPSYSYGIYPTVAKTADGFILGRGSYTYYQYSGQGYSLKSIDNAGVLGTQYGIIGWSVYTGSNFRDNPGFIYRLSGNSFYIIASTDRSMTCGYDDGLGKVWFGWDEGLTTAQQGFIYSYDGDRVKLEAKGSSFPGWETNGRVRSIIRKDNEIIALAGGALGNGVIYVRSLTDAEYRNDNKSYGLFNKYVHGTTYRYSALTVDRIFVNEGIKDTSSAYTTITNGTLSAASASSVLLDGAGNATYQTGSIDGITVSSDVDGGIMIGSDYPFESVWMYLTSADSSGSWSSSMSNWMYWNGSIWNNITLSYNSTNGFHGTNYTAKFGLPSSILSDWAKSNQGYGSKYYIMSNWGYVSATIDSISTVNIMAATTTINLSSSSSERLWVGNLSASTATCGLLIPNKISYSNNTSVYWSVAWPEIGKGVGNAFAIAGTQASGNLTNSNLNENGLAVNLSSSTTTTVRYYIPIKPNITQYGSTLSVTSGRFQYIWNGAVANDTSLCVATCYMGVRKWAPGNAPVWVGSVSTTLVSPTYPANTMSVINYTGTSGLAADGAVYYFQVDMEFWRSTAPSANQYVYFLLCSMWGKYD